MSQTLTIGKKQIGLGQQVSLNLPLARLYTHTQMTMPIHVIRGEEPGPCLFISAAIHGDEINGVEIIYRLLKLEALKLQRGTLIAIPIVNVYGFLNHSRYLPDRRDLNRSFPGLSKGSLAARIAALFMREIVQHSTHGIDLHTGSNHRTNYPQIRGKLANTKTMAMAQAFQAPIIMDANLRDGSLREAVAAKNIPMLLYEAGEALRFDETAIQLGLSGIIGVMLHLEMLDRWPTKRPSAKPSLVAYRSKWVRAPQSGILHTHLQAGYKVNKTEPIGNIADPLGNHEITIKAPISGVVVGLRTLPLVHRGDALFHIASA